MKIKTLPLQAAAAIVCAAALAVGAAQAAHADSQDATYLRALHNRGISMDSKDGGDQALISFGHDICDALAEGYSMNAIEDQGDLVAQNLTHDDVVFMVKAAAATYCPRYIH